MPLRCQQQNEHLGRQENTGRDLKFVKKKTMEHKYIHEDVWPCKYHNKTKTVKIFLPIT